MNEQNLPPENNNQKNKKESQLKISINYMNNIDLKTIRFNLILSP